MNVDRQRRQIIALAACSLMLPPRTLAQSSDVLLRVDMVRGTEGTQGGLHDASPIEAVVWLSPLTGEFARTTPSPRSSVLNRFVLKQKDKQFTPHLLVVPTGSSVDFPNLDPFFHNVFSLFNGKRFDLGLYEAHTNRAVRFDREGISYIFCNIHPKMGAVVLALSTPFYAVSQANGQVTLRNIPSGSYRLHVWSENVPAEQLVALERNLKIDPAHTNLGVLILHSGENIMEHHENKFGKEYTKDPGIAY